MDRNDRRPKLAAVELHRQELPPPRRPQPPQRVPEANPPLLGDWFIYLSVVVLFCGVIAISALEFGNEPDLGRSYESRR